MQGSGDVLTLAGDGKGEASGDPRLLAIALHRPDAGAALFLAVVAISAVFAHAPARVRHRVLLPARWAQLPNVPTGAEAGLPPFTAGTWAALFGPAKLPADIAQKMNKALNDAMAKPEVREKIGPLGFELAGSTPDEMGKFLQEQLVAWAKAFKDAGMQAE